MRLRGLFPNKMTLEMKKNYLAIKWTNEASAAAGVTIVLRIRIEDSIVRALTIPKVNVSIWEFGRGSNSTTNQDTKTERKFIRGSGKTQMLIGL